MLTGIIQYSHELLKKSLEKGDTVIDATCGNGHDTLFLCQTVGHDGHVYAFDIQEQAINNSQTLIEEHGYSNVTFIQDSHADIDQYIPEELKGELGGAIFNLGYLPKGDKSIITKGESTIQALKTILAYLKKQRLVVLVVYPGHEGGETEKDMLLEYVMDLDHKDFTVLRYEFINIKTKPPFIIAIEKKQ